MTIFPAVETACLAENLLYSTFSNMNTLLSATRQKRILLSRLVVFFGFAFILCPLLW